MDDRLNAAAREAFLQAADGFEVELDAELAEAMGAFTEDAVTLEDVMTDILNAEAVQEVEHV